MTIYINEEMIYESVNDTVDIITSKARKFYQHMLKWKWYKNDSEEKYTSWINTIKEANKTISNKIYTKNGKLQSNINNRSNNLLHDYYIFGAKDALEELPNIDFIKLDKDEAFNDFSKVELICDKEYLKEWLLNYTSDKYKYLVYNGFNNKKG